MILIPDWVFGVIFQLIGSFFSNLGINVQKYSHSRRESMLPSDPEKNKPYYKTSVWIIGFALFCFGEMCAGVAMGYSSQSLLAVLSSYSLILNGIFSMLLTGSKISTTYIKSSAIIMFGSILVILSTTHHKQQYTLHDLGLLFRSWPFLIFLVFLTLFLSALFLIRSVMPRNPTLLTIISSFMSCISVLLAKCTMQLVKTSFLDSDSIQDNQFLISIWPWVIMCLFAVFATLNVHFMNMALQTSSTTHVYPLYYSSSTILVILNGMLFFQEYLWFTFTQSIIFSMGVSICLTGITSLREEEEEEGHKYDIIPKDSPEQRNTILSSYPSNFFLRQDEDYDGSSFSTNQLSSTYQNSDGNHSDSTQFFSPTFNLMATADTPGSSFSIDRKDADNTGIGSSYYSQGRSGQYHNNKNFHNPNWEPSTGTTGISSARSPGLTNDGQFVTSQANFVAANNTIFQPKNSSNDNNNNNNNHDNNPNSGLNVPQNDKFYHQNQNFTQQGKLTTNVNGQFIHQNPIKNEVARPVVKSKKTRVVRQSQAGSRLTSFFESQANM